MDQYESEKQDPERVDILPVYLSFIEEDDKEKEGEVAVDEHLLKQKK